MSASKYFSPRIILNLSLIFGISIFFGMLIFRLGGEISTQAGDLMEKKAIIGARSSAITRLAELRKEATQAETAIETLRSIIPTRDELFSFSRYLESLGSRYGVTVGFSFIGKEIESTESTAGQSPFRVTVSGSYDEIVAFVRELESSSYFTSINGVNMSTVGDGEYRADINGIVFFYGQG